MHVIIPARKNAPIRTIPDDGDKDSDKAANDAFIETLTAVRALAMVTGDMLTVDDAGEAASKDRLEQERRRLHYWVDQLINSQLEYNSTDVKKAKQSLAASRRKA